MSLSAYASLGSVKKYLINQESFLREFVVRHLCFVLCWHVSLRPQIKPKRAFMFYLENF